MKLAVKQCYQIGKFNWTKIDGKCQNANNSNVTFSVNFKHCVSVSHLFSSYYFRCDQVNCFYTSVIVKLMTHLNEDQNNFSSPSVRRAMSLKQNHAFDI